MVGNLRAAMVERIVAAHPQLDRRVVDVMREVPRHRFLPRVGLRAAYADQAVVTKRAADGATLSSASQPSLVALMLTQLDVAPGQRVLEIGAGTGYNAALLARLVGDRGEVTTLDVDEDLAAQARRALDETGHRRVRVLARDGQLGAAEHAPYDRLIATVGSWDLPPTWWDQVHVGGRLVAPLRWRGQTSSLALVRQPDRLTAYGPVQSCSFVPLVGQPGEQSADLDADGHVTLHFDVDQAVRPERLAGVLGRDRTTRWTGVTVGGGEVVDGIWLRLTGVEAGTCGISADQRAVGTGLCTPVHPSRSPAVVLDDSLAYLARRPDGDDDRLELGAVGHGSRGAEAAVRLCHQVEAWDRDRAGRPAITAYRLDAGERPTGSRPGIEKRHCRLVVTP